MDAEDSGGLGFVITRGGEDFLDVAVFEFAERDETAAVGGGFHAGLGTNADGTRAGVVADLFRQGDHVDVAFGREDRGALDDVLQFADVAGPGIALQEFGGGGGEPGELFFSSRLKCCMSSRARGTISSTRSRSGGR